jgi:chemotaxis protein MotA
VSKAPARRIDAMSLLGVPMAIGVVLLAQVAEGGSARSLWQPTAALIVFGGTCAAVLVSVPMKTILRTIQALVDSFITNKDEINGLVKQLVGYAVESRRRGLLALESEIESSPEGFLRSALTLAVDGTNPKLARQILDIEHQMRFSVAELPATVLETAAGYTPTLGILGAVLGLIHVMESLSEPAKLGSGIAVAFVATVYGVGAANLVLLPLATKLRGRAREDALCREVIIEGVIALQEGLNPRLVAQKLQSYVKPSRLTPRTRRAA